jgi:dihydropteroate synthase
MGALNATPDSFSGDGLLGDTAALVLRGLEMLAAGADILDIGGESTRPGFRDVPEDEEIRRVVPAVEAVSAAVTLPISIDTRKAGVARRAVAAGAVIVNDVSGLSDNEMLDVVADSGASIVIVHSVRVDRDADLVDCVRRDLSASAERAVGHGVPEAHIVLDPGLGFGKRWLDNFAVLRRLRELTTLGFPVLVGPSRKGMIGKVLGVDVDDRLEGTIALVCLAIANGADMVRVHDVAENVRAARMMDALVRAQTMS